jgi:hypothetical protein
MRFLGKISLVLFFLTFPAIVPTASKLELCDASAWSSDVEEYGTNGQDGVSGQNGTKGQNSDNITIFADASPITLNLPGQNGVNGNPGNNGKDANCGKPPEKSDRSLVASNGGNGGSGGSGGDGGNGGTLTVYTTNIDNLRQVAVNAAGGQGGNPGKGGTGGKGCNCSEPYWTIETCEGDPGDPDYSCTTRQFTCQSGRDGANGSDGRPGREGGVGNLIVINSDKPLQKDQPTATLPISELKNTGYTLSQNLWETREGAIALLAPGSVIGDRYRILTKRIERSFLLIWNAPQTSDSFADKPITLSLDKQKNIKVALPEDLWIEGTTQQQGNITQLIVYNAMLASEATQLKSEGLTGTGSDLRLTLVDGSPRSNLIATKFRLKYRTTRSDPSYRELSDYSTKYNGEIPSELIVNEGNRFVIDIGKLPVEANALRSGTGVEVDLVAVRSFADYSTEQRVVVRDILGTFN